ncbi:hypothetical protein AA12717_3001 [Gluconacetobacter sacchari DSM 12717]|uniref:Uncharacterized protein n=2 Tax=Gluconacetobacter sacchari TaxID=92759 RepID=A0A7W4IC95_9PROT|nr:hypothetical protein [Gluconacetobacter sacchari]MBB2160231.1 hypothetical protein [Gluconacetobacter sacchari]GBQ28587.1 hypothetical protein AA12717_3001 [Gluconacetobacter sacchari DSM 12717]
MAGPATKRGHVTASVPYPARDVLLEVVPGLSPGIGEIFAHPADDTGELRAYDHRFTHIRIHDAACLTDLSLTRFMEQQGIRRITCREIRDVMRMCRRGMIVRDRGVG